MSSGISPPLIFVLVRRSAYDENIHNEGIQMEDIVELQIDEDKTEDFEVDLYYFYIYQTSLSFE